MTRHAGPPDDLSRCSAAELSDLIRDRAVSCVDVMTAFLGRIDERNGELNAIVSLRDREQLLAEARERDSELARGIRHGWMHGLPQAIKDLSETSGIVTTYGSPMFRRHVPREDSLMVERMRASGCIVIGKTNTPEFGKGSHTFNEVFGATRNAYDPTRSAGGSSGGAAVAVASHMLPVADGSDYMGSLRNPAAWNNVYGFRPSAGRVPGLPAPDHYFAPIGTEGPIGRTVLDVLLLLATQAGYDRRVPTSLDGDLSHLADTASAREALRSFDPPHLRVGWLADLGGHLAVEAGILDRCEAGLAQLAQTGATVAPAHLPVDLDEVWDAWVTLRNAATVASFGAVLASDGDRSRLKPEILWEFDAGAALTAADITRATEVRTRFYAKVESLFGEYDLLALPTAQVWPFPIEQRWPTEVEGRAMDTYHRWMEVTIYASFAGLPAISVPVGFGPDGLPMGMQLIGPPRADLFVLRAANAYSTTMPSSGRAR